MTADLTCTAGLPNPGRMDSGQHSCFCDGDTRELERASRLGSPVLLGGGLPATENTDQPPTPPVTVSALSFSCVFQF